ncbi:MAG: hypothetical protein WB402_06685 [Sulfuricaulis sp.]|uniref:hypothetical protein n=1 Tax=Sulfuricaulis sp. TaxID=2003553 RepID=UPI003C3171FC
MMLISLCLLVSACTSTRDIYRAVYNTLQFHAKDKNLPDNATFPDQPVSFQQYEAERKTLLESQGKSTKKAP